MQFVKGMRDKLEKYIDVTRPFVVEIKISGNAIYDCCCFGVDVSGKLSNEEYMIFYNQVTSPKNEINLRQNGDVSCFDINLNNIPNEITKLVFTISIDGSGTMAEINSFSLCVKQDGKECITVINTKRDFAKEKAIISAEIYKKSEWRIAAISNGFNGGLDLLLSHFGGIEDNSLKSKSTNTNLIETTIPKSNVIQMSEPRKIHSNTEKVSRDVKNDLIDYENNLERIIRNIAILDGVKDEHSIAGYVFAVKKQVNDWTFMELDTFFEEGIGENMTILPDELFAVAVGYSLLLRYNLHIERYQQWAKEQRKYTDYLLEVVGIKKLVSKKDTIKQCDEVFSKICKELKRKRKLINFTEEKTSYTIFGRYIQLGANVNKCIEFFLNLEKANEYAKSILKNGLNTRCKDYKECSKNIVSILRDATDAIWVICKRYLISINIDKVMINKIDEEYRDSISEIFKVKEYLDDALMQLKDLAVGKAEEIISSDKKRRNHQFIGGGFGIGGMITGMIGAGIMNSVNSSWADARLKLSAEKLHEELLKSAKEIYLGSKTCELYEALVETAKQELENICINYVFSNDMESQYDAEEFVNNIHDISKVLTGDQLREIAAYTLFVFPCSIHAYKLIFDLFMGVRNELVNIACVFHLENIVENWNDKLIEIDEDEIVFSDYVISRKTENVVEWKNLRYCGKTYKLEFKSEFPFSILGNVSYAKSDHAVFVSEEGDIISIWGGKEGEEIFRKEIRQSSAEILEQVNGFENVNIKDFSQVVETLFTGEMFIQILRVELVWDSCYDSFMFTYLDKDVFISICYGNKNGIESNSSKYYDMLKGLRVSLCESKEISTVLYLTKGEVFKELRKNAKRRAVEYYSKFKYSINDRFISLFRRSIKALLDDTQYANALVNKYDYEIESEEIITLLSKEERKGQYVLYFSKHFLVTDFIIIILDKEGKKYKFFLEDLRELLPIKYCLGGAEQICIRTLDGKYETVYINGDLKDEYIFITSAINFALKDSTNVDIQRDYDMVMSNKWEDFIFCKKCRKVTLKREEKGTIFRHVYCENCDATTKYIDQFMYNPFYEKFKRDYDKKKKNCEKKGHFRTEDEIDSLYRLKEEEINVNQIIEKADKYHKAKEYLKAKNIYINGLRKSLEARAIIETFFDAENRGLKLLERYVDNKKNILLREYETVMSVLAKIENQEEKTLLLYAAEANNIKLVNELVIHIIMKLIIVQGRGK